MNWNSFKLLSWFKQFKDTINEILGVGQDYKVIAPKEGRSFENDVAAMGELKKAALNGTAFDCLLKGIVSREETLDRVLGIYEDGLTVFVSDIADGKNLTIDLPYSVTQYQGLSVVQEAEDEEVGFQGFLPQLTKGQDGVHLSDDTTETFVCIDGKYLTVTGSETLEALTIAETGPAENFINITWEDAQKLIGLPLI